MLKKSNPTKVMIHKNRLITSVCVKILNIVRDFLIQIQIEYI